jgi:hypothetical protein
MNAPQKRESQAGTNLSRRTTSVPKFVSLQSRGARLSPDWRERLPHPANYYAEHIENLSRPNAVGWSYGHCPFHDDRNASLSVQVANARGNWRCFAGCGSGDLVAFHQKLTGLSFRDAVRQLSGEAR